jgi:tRNA(Ile)-lysidine synthase
MDSRIGYNFIEMLENVIKIMQEKCQLVQDRPLIVGVSGGADSLCVLDLLQRSGYSPIIAYFNHKLRPEADQEAGMIHQMADRRNLPFLSGQAQVRRTAADDKQSIEEAARHARYSFLFDQAKNKDAQAVVVGHSADDQVETILMHFLRGAGTDGLRGMDFRSLPNAWSADIPLVRPLLSTWRSQILEYCQKRGLEPINDPTNQDLTYFRNRLRHELIPYLESYNPSVSQVIWRTAEILRADAQVLDGLLQEVWQACMLESGPGYIALDRGRSSQQPLSIQRNLIRRAIASLRPDLRDINFNAVEVGRSYFQPSMPPAETDLIAGLKLTSEPGRLWISEWEALLPTAEWPQVSEPGSTLTIPGIVHLAAGWQLAAEQLPSKNIAGGQLQMDADPFQAWLDAENIRGPLQVRPRQPGDRFQPHGMGGHSVKVSDFMINVKLPHRARRAWPLVCSEGQIIWVPGFRIAHPFRVNGTTSRIVRLRLKQEIDLQDSS